jgi:hypothetical protein
MDFSAAIANEEWWRDLGFALLVYGLFGEIIGLTIPKERGRLEKIWSALATLVIVIGVWVEHSADNRISALSEQQKIAADKELAAANERIENLRAGNLALENALRQRRILGTTVTAETAEKYNTLVRNVRRFAGTKALVQVVSDVEAKVLANDLFALLRGLKWDAKYTDEKETNRPEHMIPEGVEIHAPPSMKDAADALASYLTEIGLHSSGGVPFPVVVWDALAELPQQDSVIILIGTRPLSGFLRRE